MPKKKKQKGQVRDKNRQAEDSDIVNCFEEVSDSVTDCERINKFSRRGIESNWAKYKPVAEIDESNRNDYELPETLDFTSLMNNTASECSYFEFNSEKLWKKEVSLISSSGLFCLDLNVLCNGLACVPFYDRIDLKENELYDQEKLFFDEEAKKNLVSYNKIKENFLKRLNPSKCNKDICRTYKNIEKLDDKSKNSETLVNYIESNEIIGVCKSDNVETDVFEDNASNVKEPKKIRDQETLFNDNENLEDWLDRVLDE